MVSVKLLIITTLLGLTVALPEPEKDKKKPKTGLLLSSKDDNSWLSYKACSSTQANGVDCPKAYPNCCAATVNVPIVGKICAASCNKKTDCTGAYEPDPSDPNNPKGYVCGSCSSPFC